MPFTELYLTPTGSALNAGSTADDAALQTYAGGTFVRSTRVFTVASGNPTSDGVAVGQFASIYTTSGATVATFVGRITARDTTTITLDATSLLGATSTVSESAAAATCKVGGAWTGWSAGVTFPWGLISGALVNTSSHETRLNVKGGTDYFWDTAATLSGEGPLWIQGYTSTPGDGGRAKIAGDLLTEPFTALTVSGNHIKLISMEFHRNGFDAVTNANGPYMVTCTGTDVVVEDCIFRKSWRCGLRIIGDGAVVRRNLFAGNNVDGGSGFAQLQTARSCLIEENLLVDSRREVEPIESHDCDAILVTAAPDKTVVIRGNIMANNAGRGIMCTSSSVNMQILNNTIYSHGSDGIYVTSSASSVPNSSVIVENNIIAENEGFGLRIAHATWGPRVRNNAFYANDTASPLSSVTGANAGDLFTKASHGLATGDFVTAASFSAGFTAGFYYVIRTDANTFQLASTMALALAGTAVPITADGTGGVIAQQTRGGNYSIMTEHVGLTGNPLTDGPNGDYALNSTAGAGAACRNAGLGSFLADSDNYSDATTTHPSIGAAIPSAVSGAANFGPTGSVIFN